MKEWQDPDLAGGRVLLVACNEFDFMHLWVGDWFRYFFDCYSAGLQGSKTYTVTLNNIMAARPREETPMGYVYARSTDGQSLGLDHVPGSPSSIFSLATSMLATSMHRNFVTELFDVDMFWRRISEDGHDRPWLPLAFSRFLGQVEPTAEMIAWATATVAAWADRSAIPVALQILSHSWRDPDSVLDLVEARVSRGRWWEAIVKLVDFRSDRDLMLEMAQEFEYIAGLGQFLSRAANGGSVRAAKRIIHIERRSFSLNYEGPMLAESMLSVLECRTHGNDELEALLRQARDQYGDVENLSEFRKRYWDAFWSARKQWSDAR
jgi:hypothetical protein